LPYTNTKETQTETKLTCRLTRRHTKLIVSLWSINIQGVVNV